MVGGTGLYIDGVIFDYNFLPAGPPGQREELENMSREELLSKLRQQGIELGTTDIRNKRRLMRLLETNGRGSKPKVSLENTVIIGLLPDRDQLKGAHHQKGRSHASAGLEQEVQN